MEIGNITYFKTWKEETPVFSILIPTWNSLEYLQLCIGSIRKNSRFIHQVIVHVNEGTDGTYEWVKNQGLDHSYSSTNVGVCYAFNAAATLARSDYFLLIDDDNYLLPDWDYHLWQEIQNIGHAYFALSGTKIEPRKTLNKCAIAPFDFGTAPDNFNETELLGTYKGIPFNDWNGSSWYPLVVHKSLWNLVGGLSVEFTPGMYSDPDFMMKLWQAGVRYFKGVSASRSYHFISRSVRRIRKNSGRKQFLLKWGISNSTFRKHYLRMGDPFGGCLDEPEKTIRYRYRLLRDRIKFLFSF